jgi:hypothetical protein
MKNKIASIIIGVLSVVSMGYSSTSIAGDPDGLSSISILKGTVMNTDHDSHWEVVNFGIDGFDQHRDEVVLVEILSKNGRLLGRVANPIQTNLKDGQPWYVINLDEFKVNKEFYLEIHVVKKRLTDLNGLSATANTGSAAEAPIDPEETILIVKYP